LHLHQCCMQCILFFQQWTLLYPPRDDVTLPPPVSFILINCTEVVHRQFLLLYTVP
jgi:hypothetical protein